MHTSGTHTSYPTKSDLIETVLRLAPRVAAFDCDGTLWSSDAGQTFFDWEIKNGVVPAEVGVAMRARYAEYKAGRVSEDDMCAEMVTMHRGIAETVMMEAATEFMSRHFCGVIYPEMQELIRRLHENGCEVWAVSSSNEWVIRVGVRPFEIPESRVLAVKAELQDGIVTDHVVRIPNGPGKAQALREVAGKEVDVAFGNSQWDTEMLAMARYPFAINPKPELEATARERRWTIYFLEGTPAAV